MIRQTVYSKYEARAMGVKVKGDEAYTAANCVGTLEDELDVIVVQKRCRGIVETERPRGAGTGTVNYTGHFPYVLYAKVFDMVREDLKDGVQGYGRENFHKEFAAVVDVYNEDNERMLLAYPRMIISVGPNTNITNGEEEVAEIELEIHLMPDDFGYCKYETIVDDLDEADKEELVAKWMSQFTPELVRKSHATVTAPTVTPEDGGSNAYGKTVNQLQEGVTIEGTKISGTLHYVKDYSEFSSDGEKQKGNFLALKIEYPKDVTVKVRIIGGEAGEKTIPADDHLLVARIKDKDAQMIKLTAEKGDASASVVYDLTGLALDPEN